MAAPHKPIVWIDLETTGLDVYNGRILEIACVITDGDLNIIAEAPDLIIKTDKRVLDNMDEWCTNVHGKSGLTKACIKSTVTLNEAESQILEFVKKYVPFKKGILAGNSVHFDKEFMRRGMPDLLDYLHFQIIDVTTITLCLSRWNKAILDRRPTKKFSHRALDDIRESIEQLRFYKENAFNCGDTVAAEPVIEDVD